MDDPDKIRQQAAYAAANSDPSSGGGTLFTEPVLVVNQKAKLFEGTTNFSVFKADGTQIGAVRQVGQTTVGKLLKMFSNLDAMLKSRFEIVDGADQVQLVIDKPPSFLKGRVSVQKADGTEIGQIHQKLRLGKAKFLLMGPGGENELGSLDAENFRAWNFAISDGSGSEVARVSKTWAGFGKELFTNADNYVVEMKARLEDPLLSLTIASALTVDTLLKQWKS